MIAVVDYKAGNLTSVLKGLAAAGASDFTVTEDPALVRSAAKIILPGVGHFSATEHLAKHGLTEAIRERAAAGVPFLGICVGLQWLFEGSTEAPDAPGLGAFAGDCTRFNTPGLKCPHVGWNSVEIAAETPLTRGIRSGEYMYFTHSYRAPVVSATSGVTDYGGPFTAIVERDNVMGMQFHPEKSGPAGLRLLRNFLEIAC